MTKEDLAEFFRVRRKELRMTRQDFGRLVGASPSTVENWENGIDLIVTAKVMTAIERSGKRIVIRDQFTQNSWVRP